MRIHPCGRVSVKQPSDLSGTALVPVPLNFSGGPSKFTRTDVQRVCIFNQNTQLGKLVDILWT